MSFCCLIPENKAVDFIGSELEEEEDDINLTHHLTEMTCIHYGNKHIPDRRQGMNYDINEIDSSAHETTSQKNPNSCNAAAVQAAALQLQECRMLGEKCC